MTSTSSQPEMKNYIDFRINSFILQLVGLWFDTDRPVTSRWKTIYSYVPLILYATTVLTEILGLYMYWGDFKSATVNACIILLIVPAFFKSAIFLYMHERIRLLLHNLRHDFPLPDDEEKLKILEKAGQTARNITLLFAISGSIAVAVWNLVPGFYKYFWPHEQAIEFDYTSLPIIAWYPFDLTNETNYLVIYVYQVLSFTMCSFVHLGWDTVYVCFIIYIGAQLDILKLCFSRIGNETHEDDRNDYQLSLMSKEEAEKTSEDMRKQIVQCIQFHQDIIRYIADLEEVVSPIAMFQLADSVIIICLSGFQATVTTGDTGSFWKFCNYLTMAAYQLLLYCWYGQEIINKSEQVSQAVYGCAWPRAQKRVRHILQFTMMRAQKPLKIRAAAFYTMSLDTYVKLLNASYSMFAVLRQVIDKN